MMRTFLHESLPANRIKAEMGCICNNAPSEPDLDGVDLPQLWQLFQSRCVSLASFTRLPVQ